MFTGRAGPTLLTADLNGSALDSTQKDKLGQKISVGGFPWSVCSSRGLFAARLGYTMVAVHHIETGDPRPTDLPSYQTSPLKKKLINIQSMLKRVPDQRPLLFLTVDYFSSRSYSSVCAMLLQRFRGS